MIVVVVVVVAVIQKMFVVVLDCSGFNEIMIMIREDRQRRLCQSPSNQSGEFLYLVVIIICWCEDVMKACD
jgi:hypothetical protein